MMLHDLTLNGTELKNLIFRRKILKISIDKCIQEALEELKPSLLNTRVLEEECQIYAWPQTWEDASCGFGGLACQAVTTSISVVVIGPNLDACIFHGGVLSYKINEVSNKFWECVQNHNLPGQLDSRSHLEKEFGSGQQHRISG